MLTMIRRRHRKLLATLTCFLWVFAVSVATANVCPATPSAASAGQAMAMAGEASHNQQPSANCLQFCADDTPVFSKLQLSPDAPLVHPLLVTTGEWLDLPNATAPVVEFAHPPPGVPVLLRSSRLAL
jgi:hypothetical protein